MPSYTPPAQDIAFVLHDVLQVEDSGIAGYESLDPNLTTAVVDEAGKLARDVLAPLNQVGDQQGCKLENGVVRTPDGFAAAYDKMRAGGWMGLDCDPAYGGQGMPYLLYTAVNEMFVSANMAFNIYQGLTHGAYSAIHAHGSAAQKATYLAKMVSGDWSGTMNLTEPHCGTDLGLMRTKAEPQDDGSYAISGTKIFISAGEHDLSDNIVHLVLARVSGAKAGIGGISLFIVPKFLVNDDGSLGARNAATCTRLENKMGIHGNATCEMTFDGATGYLLGEASRGMRAMFTMMNEARLGVALQGYAQAASAYQAARDYARERLQGRDVTGIKNPDGPADPIIVHPDVRRSLMDQKSFVEGARAFTYWCAKMIDKARLDDDADADALVSLLTPVLKGFLTDQGFAMTVQAQQIFGGHGYIEDNGMSQFARDARIAMIYEGSNGVQALDLVGRKLAADGGAPVRALFAMIQTCTDGFKGVPVIEAEFAAPLKAATADLQSAVGFFVERGLADPNEALSGSTDFLHLVGHVMMGLSWTQQAAAAQRALEAGKGDADFYRAKLATGRYYMARHLPATGLLLKRIRSGAKPVMALKAAQF